MNVIQISSSLKSISIQFETSLIMETFCTEPLQVREFSYIPSRFQEKYKKIYGNGSHLLSKRSFRSRRGSHDPILRGRCTCTANVYLIQRQLIDEKLHPLTVMMLHKHYTKETFLEKPKSYKYHLT